MRVIQRNERVISKVVFIIASIAMMTMMYTEDTQAVVIGLGPAYGANWEEWSGKEKEHKRFSEYTSVETEVKFGQKGRYKYVAAFGIEESYPDTSRPSSPKLSSKTTTPMFYGATFIQSIEISLNKTQNVDVWIGPQLKSTYYDFTGEENVDGAITTYRGKIRGTGVGLNFGINFQPDKFITYLVKVGYRISKFDGKYTRTENGLTSKTQINHIGKGPFAGVSMIFKIGK